MVIKMEFRLADIKDLPQLKAVYKDIIEDMNHKQIQIWDDIYPCGFFEEDIRNNRLYLFSIMPSLFLHLFCVLRTLAKKP